jgi:hypothetical protein
VPLFEAAPPSALFDEPPPDPEDPDEDPEDVEADPSASFFGPDPDFAEDRLSVA